ncbi:MAG: CBS domain-containing protein [Micrococcales bacterium]|nr:CBS domain-containing protein [Micrococcales bacterium]
MTAPGTRVFVARLAGTPVFDPLGDPVGRVRDVVLIERHDSAPHAVGLVVEVPGRRRIFLPLTRVTGIDAGQVISTGVLNMRRFERRAAEALVVGQLLERTVQLTDGSGAATLDDLAIECQRGGDWLATRVSVRDRSGGGLLRRRGTTRTLPLDRITGLFAPGQPPDVARLLERYGEMKPADVADELHAMETSQRVRIAAGLPDVRLADVLEELPEEDQVAILAGLEIRRAADVLEEMQPDDATDLLRELPEERKNELLAAMEPDEADDVRRLLGYEDRSAGGLMTTEPVILGPETSIATALAYVRRQDLNPALASTVFVVRPPLDTPTGRFLGVVHLQRMLRHPPHESIGQIADRDIQTLRPGTPLATVARELATYNLLILPVVDDERRLLGAVSIDDVLDHLLPEHWRTRDHDCLDGAGDG